MTPPPFTALQFALFGYMILLNAFVPSNTDLSSNQKADAAEHNGQNFPIERGHEHDANTTEHELSRERQHDDRNLDHVQKEVEAGDQSDGNEENDQQDKANDQTMMDEEQKAKNRGLHDKKYQTERQEILNQLEKLDNSIVKHPAQEKEDRERSKNHKKTDQEEKTEENGDQNAKGGDQPKEQKEKPDQERKQEDETDEKNRYAKYLVERQKILEQLEQFDKSHNQTEDKLDHFSSKNDHLRGKEKAEPSHKTKSKTTVNFEMESSTEEKISPKLIQFFPKTPIIIGQPALSTATVTQYQPQQQQPSYSNNYPTYSVQPPQPYSGSGGYDTNVGNVGYNRNGGYNSGQDYGGNGAYSTGQAKFGGAGGYGYGQGGYGGNGGYGASGGYGYGGGYSNGQGGYYGGNGGGYSMMPMVSSPYMGGYGGNLFNFGTGWGFNLGMPFIGTGVGVGTGLGISVG